VTRRLAPWIGVLLAACSSRPASEPAPRQPATGPINFRPAVDEESAGLRRGAAPPPALARRPRFKPPTEEKRGLQVLPDGNLREWEVAGASWITLRPVTGAKGFTGAEDLSAKLAVASYGSGLSLAVDVRDDRRRHAKVSATLRRSDHVEVEVWPGGRPRATLRLRDRAVGVRVLLGGLRELVELVRPSEAWRQAAIRSFGADDPEGYHLEVRLPLPALTPLPAPRVDRLDYRVTVYDTDEEDEATEPTLRAEGSVSLDPPLEVPEAVQRRGSVRACIASEPDALWGYEGGWRCSVPYLEKDTVVDDDARPGSDLRFGHSLLPEPPTLVWIRERVIFVNLLGVDRGIAALLDKKGTLLSLLPLGVVGALDPGSTWAKDSDAEPIQLPDGAWAVAVTHAYPAATSVVPGGRCAVGHRVLLSVLALRGCLVSTPHVPAPDPPFPPYLEEVFRASLEDCEDTSAHDWTLSKDRSTITVHDSLYPGRAPRIYRYRDGRYRRAES